MLFQNLRPVKGIEAAAAAAWGHMQPMKLDAMMKEVGSLRNPTHHLLVLGITNGYISPKFTSLIVIGVCVFTFATLRFHKRAG